MRIKPQVVVWLLWPALAPAQEAEAPVQTVTVLGQGQTRQVQNITRTDLVQALPGTSALKTLEKLPGVSFQSADPLGSYEWSTRISIRGFSQGQLGFTLDGIPLGNMSYGNNNGLHISRAISAENIRQVDLSQGAGAVGTASTSNLGGTVQFFSADPSVRPAALATVTLGSSSTRREFVRFDSGSFGADARAYLSLSRQRAQKWKGIGPQQQDQLNTRYVQDFGPHRLSAFFNWSDRRETDYQDLSLDMQRRLGWDWDNYAPDWQRAVDTAHGIYTGGVTNMDDAYYGARGLRQDRLGGVTLALAYPGASVTLTGYHHGNEGQGHWFTPYQASPNGIPISIRTTEYAINRNGMLGAVLLERAAHQLEAGFWAEHGDHLLTRNYYAIDAPPASLDDSNRFLRNPFLTGFQQDFQVGTLQFHARDTMRLLDGKLKLEAGAKWTRTVIDATSINAKRAAGRLEAAKPFLPQVSGTWALADGDEVFASVARGLRAFEAGVYGQFSQDQAAFDANAGKLRPETSLSTDLGYRFRRGPLNGSVALYRARFHDRLLSVATCAGVVGCPNTVVNVGSVATHGMEAALIYGFAPHWSWFNSLTWNASRYQSDYLDNGQTVPVAGKQVVDTPRRMVGSELAYSAGGSFVRLAAKFTDRRYYSFVNDAAVPAYTLVNLSAGTDLGSWHALRALSLRAYASNLLNRRYFSTVGSNQFVASDPQGTFATLLTGAPRQLALSLSGSFGP